MGRNLARALAMTGGGLSGNAFKVLNLMCHVALDKPNEAGKPPRLYYAGWESLAAALRKPLTATQESAMTHSEHAKWLKSAMEAVRIALKELEADGWIERLGNAHLGNRQTYRVLVDPFSCPKEMLEQEDEGAHSQETLGHMPQENLGRCPKETLAPRKDKNQ